jgi:hypothetical protein
MPIPLSLPLLFQDRPMLIRFNVSSTARCAPEEEKDSIGQKKEETKLLFLSMISTCHRKRSMELSLPLSY